MGRRRRRVYERKFDWAEARARYAAGEMVTAIAKSYGVDYSAVQRVLKLPAHLIATATSAEMERLGALRRHQVPCPRCERPMSRTSELCRDCSNETRFNLELRIETIPGQSRVVLADVEVGRIVRIGKRVGVVCRGGRGRWRVVDFWWEGRERVELTTIVATLPAKRLFLDGIEETPEEIAA